MSHLHSEGAEHCSYKLVDLSERKLKVKFVSQCQRRLLFDGPTLVFASARASSYTETYVSPVHSLDPVLALQPPLWPKAIRVLAEHFFVLLDYMRVHCAYKSAGLQK